MSPDAGGTFGTGHSISLASRRFRIFIRGDGLQDRSLGMVTTFYTLLFPALISDEQNTDGQRREIWGMLPVRVTHMVVTPDFTRLVAIGLRAPSPVDPRVESDSPPAGANGGSTSSPPPRDEHRFLVFDYATRRTETYVARSPSSAAADLLFCY